MEKLLFLLLSAVLVNNIVLIQTIGICPFIGVSRKLETAVGMGLAVIFTITMVSIVAWFIDHGILMRYGLEYLRTIAFILVIAGFVQFVEMVILKTSPTLYSALGIYLPLITTNCAVLGVALLNVTKNHNLVESTVYGFGISLGFTLALLVMAGIRERLEFSAVPEPLQGFPIALINAGLLSMAFLGFSGMM